MPAGHRAPKSKSPMQPLHEASPVVGEMRAILQQMIDRAEERAIADDEKRIRWAAFCADSQSSVLDEDYDSDDSLAEKEDCVEYPHQPDYSGSMCKQHEYSYVLPLKLANMTITTLEEQRSAMEMITAALVGSLRRGVRVNLNPNSDTNIRPIAAMCVAYRDLRECEHELLNVWNSSADLVKPRRVTLDEFTRLFLCTGIGAFPDRYINELDANCGNMYKDIGINYRNKRERVNLDFPESSNYLTNMATSYLARCTDSDETRDVIALIGRRFVIGDAEKHFREITVKDRDGNQWKEHELKRRYARLIRKLWQNAVIPFAERVFYLLGHDNYKTDLYIEAQQILSYFQESALCGKRKAQGA